MSQFYEAEFNSYKPELIEGLKNIEGFVECSFPDGEKKRIDITVNGSTDIREAPGKLAITHGAVMLSCNVRNESLENLFLSLVDDGQEP